MQLFGGGLAAPLPGSAAIQLCWHRNCQGSAAASRYTIPSEPRAEAAGEGRQLPASAPEQLLSGWGAGEGPAQPQAMVLVPSCLLDSRNKSLFTGSAACRTLAAIPAPPGSHLAPGGAGCWMKALRSHGMGQCPHGTGPVPVRGVGNISQQSSWFPFPLHGAGIPHCHSDRGKGQGAGPGTEQRAGTSTELLEERLLLGMLHSLSLSHVLCLSRRFAVGSGGQNLPRASGEGPGPCRGSREGSGLCGGRGA